MYTHTCVCIYIYIYIYIYMYISRGRRRCPRGRRGVAGPRGLYDFVLEDVQFCVFSLSPSVCIYIYIYTYTHVFGYGIQNPRREMSRIEHIKNTIALMCVYIYMYICIYVYIYTYIYAYVYYICILYIYIYIHTYMALQAPAFAAGRAPRDPAALERRPYVCV